LYRGFPKERLEQIWERNDFPSDSWEEFFEWYMKVTGTEKRGLNDILVYDKENHCYRENLNKKISVNKHGRVEI